MYLIQIPFKRDVTDECTSEFLNDIPLLQLSQGINYLAQLNFQAGSPRQAWVRISN